MSDESVNKKKDNVFSYDLEFLKWLIDRYDRWRSSIANRTAIVLSADSILLAGLTFFLKDTFSETIQWKNNDLLMFILSGIIGILFLLASLTFAAIGIANVMLSSRNRYGANMPSRGIFHPSDATKGIRNWREFINQYNEIDKSDHNKAIWAELWTLVNMHNHRYKNLRRSIRFLLLAIPFYGIALFILLSNHMSKVTALMK